MKFVDTTDYIKTPALFTPFTIVHFYSGIIGFIVIKYLYPKMSFFNIFWLFILLHTVYEVKDLLCYNEWICVNIFNSCSDLDNSYINSIGDTIAAMLGLVIAPSLVSKITDRYCANAILSFFFMWFIFASNKAG